MTTYYIFVFLSLLLSFYRSCSNTSKLHHFINEFLIMDRVCHGYGYGLGILYLSHTMILSSFSLFHDLFPCLSLFYGHLLYQYSCSLFHCPCFIVLCFIVLCFIVHCSIVHCSIVPLFHCSIVPLFHCSIVHCPLFHCSYHCSLVPCPLSIVLATTVPFMYI